MLYAVGRKAPALVLYEGVLGYNGSVLSGSYRKDFGR
jgi:hypothetical protein